MSRKQVFIFFGFETSRTMADDAFDNEDNAMTVHTAGNIAVSCAASAGDMYDRAVAGLPGIAALKLPLEQRLHKFKDVASGVTAIGSKISHQCQVAVNNAFFRSAWICTALPRRNGARRILGQYRLSRGR